MVKQGYVPLVWQGSKIQDIGRNLARRVISHSYRSLGIDDDMAGLDGRLWLFGHTQEH